MPSLRGYTDRIYSLRGQRTKPSKKKPEGIERFGLRKCGNCGKKFTARVGTVFESSHIPLHKWLQAAHLLCSSKNGACSYQLHRILKTTYHAAWFASYRLHQAMRAKLGTMEGVAAGAAEIDEANCGSASTKRRADRRLKDLGIINSPKPDEPGGDFVKACRELGIEEDPVAFDQMLKKITKAPPPVPGVM